MTYPQTEQLYTRQELDRIRLEEWCAYQGRDLATALLAKHGGNRLTALVDAEYRWSDATLGEPVERMVRDEIVAWLLSDANGVERDAWAATQAYGITTAEAALAAIAITLTHTPLPTEIAA